MCSSGTKYFSKVSRAPVSKAFVIISLKRATTCTEQTTFASRTYNFTCNLQITKKDMNLCLTISNSLGMYFQRKLISVGNVTTANRRPSPFITDPCNCFTAAVTCSLRLPFLKQDKRHWYAPCTDLPAFTVSKRNCSEVEINQTVQNEQNADRQDVISRK